MTFSAEPSSLQVHPRHIFTNCYPMLTIARVRSYPKQDLYVQCLSLQSYTKSSDCNVNFRSIPLYLIEGKRAHYCNQALQPSREPLRYVLQASVLDVQSLRCEKGCIDVIRGAMDVGKDFHGHCDKVRMGSRTRRALQYQTDADASPIVLSFKPKVSIRGLHSNIPLSCWISDLAGIDAPVDNNRPQIWIARQARKLYRPQCTT